MEQQRNGRGIRINNAQRKALVEIAGQKFARLIDQARDEDSALIEQIQEQVKKELGVTAINQEMKQLEQRKDFLEKAKKKMGFGGYGAIEGSKAQKLIDQRTSKTSKKEIALSRQRDDAMARLWTSQTIEEADGILKAISSGGASK